MQGYAAFCGKNAVYRYLFSGGGNAEALHRLFQCADVHRLGQMLVHAGFLEDMQKSKEAGMDEHLSKPVDISALEQTVKRFRVPPPRK